MQPIIARTRHILVFAGLVFAGLVSADRFIVSPAFARLRFVGPIFGSHVSKDYSRKSCFDKSSKHFFREKAGRTSIGAAGLFAWRPPRRPRHPSEQKAAATAIMAA